MTMGDCRYCGTRITTLREARAARRNGYWSWPAIAASWLHLVDGHDDHVPEPKPKKEKKGKGDTDELAFG